MRHHRSWRRRLGRALRGGCDPERDGDRQGALIPLLAIHAVAHRDAMRQARRQAELLTAQAKIASRYTADKIAPLLSEGSCEQLVFISASAPFYATQTTASMMQDAEPGVSIRQVVLNPVGASDRPTAGEHQLIERMRSESHPAAYIVEHDGPNGSMVSLVSPLLFFPGVCATCYVSRATAPVGILDALGGSAGFDNKPDEIVGVTIATVPLRSLHLAAAMPAWLAFFTVVAVGLFNLILELLVLHLLKQVASVAERISLGQTGVKEFDIAGSR